MNFSRGNFSGTLKAPTLSTTAYSGVPFNNNIKKISVSFSPDPSTYNGSPQTPSVTVKYGNNTLEEEIDYTIAYRDNIGPGTATVTITEKGSFTGIITRTFSIKKSISKCKITISPKTVTYNGKPRKVTVTVKDKNKTLKKGRDYNVTYQNNTEAGTATVIIKGTGNYTKSVTKTFQILKDLTKCKVTIKSKNLTYTGKPIIPSITVKDKNKTLKSGKDYTISCKNNTKAGKATLTLTGIGNYKGKITKKFTIKKSPQKLSYKKNVEKTYGTSRFYLGVKLKQGNGKLTYKSSNPRVAFVFKNGNGKVTITGTGIATITVTAASTHNYNAQSADITITVNPKQQIFTHLKTQNNGKYKEIFAKWKLDTQASGYELQYSTKRNFKRDTKTIPIKAYRTVSKTIPKLEKGTHYYVRVRSYKSVKVNGKTVKLYGKWSTIHKI